MREIKFRGFSKHKPEWWYGNLNYNRCLFRGEDARVWIAALSREAGNISQFLNLCHFTEVHPESVGQYTGLKDKNGKEIYEGDICFRNGHYYEIYFADGAFGIKRSNDVMAKITAMFHGHALYNYVSELVVVGNIYQNPELLTNKK